MPTIFYTAIIMLFTGEQSWDNAHKDAVSQFLATLTHAVDQEYATRRIYPPRQKLFTAFHLCPLPQVRVVVLGQDPYHREGQAHGLAFSVPDNVPLPPSLKNIYKELSSDLGVPPPISGNLSHWAVQGVLLLNTTLTVVEGQPASHRRLGWEQYTDLIIRTISQQREQVVFMLWGAHAQAKQPLIDSTRHLVLTAPHPSPLSAYTGFFGCRHFSRANAYLAMHCHKPIDW